MRRFARGAVGECGVLDVIKTALTSHFLDFSALFLSLSRQSLAKHESWSWELVLTDSSLLLPLISACNTLSHPKSGSKTLNIHFICAGVCQSETSLFFWFVVLAFCFLASKS